MKKISKNEWVGVSVAVVTIAVMFAINNGYFGNLFFNRTLPMTNSNDQSVQGAMNGAAVGNEAAAINSEMNSDSMTGAMPSNDDTSMNIKQGVAAQEAMVAQKGMIVSVNYTGKLQNGTVFDSSYTRGQPIEFVLGTGQVIPGWDEGIAGMKVGEKKHLVISPDKAYGATGIPGVIPPNSTLLFDVELMGVRNQ